MPTSTVPHRFQDRLAAQIQTRKTNDGAVIENPLAYMTDQELEEDVKEFAQKKLPCVPYEQILRAARVAKDIRMYDEVARRPGFDARHRLPVTLTDEEKSALRRERDVTFSERGMWTVIATVSLAALLQGFVQSSWNGAALYDNEWGLTTTEADQRSESDDWRLGAANASPWFVAALIGCPLSLPINYWYGRRGGIAVAASLIACSSIGAVFARTWIDLMCVRIINGLGMGIKAVSTPILASETAVGFWRGSAILAWQLWVAFGIMTSFGFNMIFTTASTPRTVFSLINGAPLVPSLALFVMAVWVCPESPRYHLMRGPNYNVEKAYHILQRVRNTELQALRDLYVVHKALDLENVGFGDLDENAALSPGFFWVIRDFFTQYKQLFRQRRLYNAVISTGTVNLAQQLFNVCAFYSGTLFSRVGKQSILIEMAYSLGFGAINFLFALPAIKNIDTLGRRKLLLMTLPLMAVTMLGAGLAGFIVDQKLRVGITALFLFLFAMAYSPGLGPIPFTLASESFPLSHREAGTSWAISINFFFAAILSLFFPSVNSAIGQAGSLGLFAALNVLALAMVFLLVEETKRRSLEDLDHIFAVSKRDFMRFQVTEILPWFLGKTFLRNRTKRPQLYKDLIWGSCDGEGDTRSRVMDELDGVETVRSFSVAQSPWGEGPSHIAFAMSPISPVSTEEVGILGRNPNAVEIGESRPVGSSPGSPLASNPPSYENEDGPASTGSDGHHYDDVKIDYRKQE
ncbi:sugar transporter [Purpureocillium lavendulum]|uniref:Sugar transporter n=1 Tax=Purpureocillium lavendulum TaxID=1247861 RepID=A0AB34FNB8_9HYPO|nr:sugar transporter [Purpureocillium lavendulum]